MTLATANGAIYPRDTVEVQLYADVHGPAPSNPHHAHHAHLVGVALRTFKVGLARVYVEPAELARMLTEAEIPGLTVSYETPVSVPTGLGAVVETADGVRWVIDGFEGKAGTTWKPISTAPRAHPRDIATMLREGGRVISEGVAE